MKKVIATIAAVVAILGAMFSTSSCVEQKGDFIYDVKVSFFDNMDILSRSFDQAFKDAGCDLMGSYWHLNGEKNTCDSRVKNAFLARAQAIDNDRSLIALPLDLKGETVTLNVQWGSDKYELAKYTFQK
ncbi:MAG: hypothetical protein J6P56_03225 [Bacteroidales bacterium]|nr:hypothetical protein [Bacteroidales bacterium]